MNGFAITRILARPGQPLDVADQDMLRRMADYFDRSSLTLVHDNGAVGDALELEWSNEAERFVTSMVELRALWAGLKRGEAVAWNRLRQKPRPTR